MSPFINKKRLLTYPILVLIALSSVTLFNVIFADGWYGRIGGFIGYDFLSIYAGGKLYWTETSDLYNLETMANLQSQLAGIPRSGLNFFPNPPYAALIYGLFSFLPYSSAFVIWTILSVVCLVISTWLIHRYLIPKNLSDNGLTLVYLLVLIFSFYPIIFGLQNGQNHSFSLFLAAMIIIFSIKERPGLAGVCAGFMIYKPQLVLGWVILWLLLKNYKTLLSFLLTGIAWVGVSLLHKGLSPYLDYLRYIPHLDNITYQTWEVTPVAMINKLCMDIFGTTNNTILFLLAVIVYTVVMFWIVRRYPSSRHPAPMILVLLFPLFNIHFMFYDLALIIPLFFLWSQISQSRIVLVTAVSIYLAVLILPAVSEAIKFPIMGFLPLLILLAVISDQKNSFKICQN